LNINILFIKTINHKQIITGYLLIMQLKKNIKMKISYKPLFITILSLSSLLLLSCNEPKNDNKNESATVKQLKHSDDLLIVSKKQFEHNKMQLGKVSVDTFFSKITAQGALDVPPSNKAVVSSYMSGKIKNIKFIVGDKVRKGQLLVQITDPDYIQLQQDYLKAKDNWEFARKEYERQQQLAAQKVVSQKKLQQAKRQYLNAKANYNALKQQLFLLHINPVNVENGKMTATINLYAPISGYISKLFVTEGSAVNENDKIMEIINNDHMHLELRVFEKNIMKVKAGQPIIYTVPGVEKRKYTGYVKLIGREIDPETRSILVHGHLNEPHPQFIAGMYIEAQIAIGKQSGLAVPASAVIKDGEHSVVLKLVKQDENDYEFKPVDVQTFEEENGKIRIHSGQIKQGDVILAKGGFFLVGAGEGGHSH